MRVIDALLPLFSISVVLSDRSHQQDILLQAALAESTRNAPQRDPSQPATWPTAKDSKEASQPPKGTGEEPKGSGREPPAGAHSEETLTKPKPQPPTQTQQQPQPQPQSQPQPQPQPQAQPHTRPQSETKAHKHKPEDIKFNIVWLGRARDYPIRHTIDTIFSQRVIDHPVSNEDVPCQDASCEATYFNHSMVVLNVGEGDKDVTLANAYLSSKPQDIRMGLFVIGDYFGHQVETLASKYALEFIFRHHHVGIGGKVHWFPHGPTDRFRKEYDAFAQSSPMSLQDSNWASRDTMCSFMGVDDYSQKAEELSSPALNVNVAERIAMATDTLGVCKVNITKMWMENSTNSYVQQMAQSKFALVPSGLGPESFRLYEALMLKTIPVMTKRSFPEALIGMESEERSPWILLDSWSDFSTVHERLISDPSTENRAQTGPRMWQQIQQKAKDDVKAVLTAANFLPN